MKNWQLKIEVLFPPGYDYMAELKRVFYLWILAVVYSLRFWWDYYDAYQRLFVWRQIPGQLKAEYVLREGAVIAPFEGLFGPCLLLMVPLAVMLTVTAIMHLLYYYQGSKSIYLMRRLPVKGIVARTSLTAPLLELLAAGITVLVLGGLYYCGYLWITPKICLP